MSCEPDGQPRPIVACTPMKSGTWLIRGILGDLTGLPWREPPLIRPMDPADPRHVLPDPGVIYSWHFHPGPAVRDKLRRRDARVVLVVRNVYAMVLSMYHHFAANIDWEIGRGAGQQGLFAGRTPEEGITRIIVQTERDRDDGFRWDGLGRHLRQIQAMLELDREHPCLLVSFEQLVSHREACIAALCTYLGLRRDEADVQAVARRSSFEAMRRRETEAGRGSHLRRGELREFQGVLSDLHRGLIAEAVRFHAPRLPEQLASVGLAHVLDWDNPVPPISRVGRAGPR